MNNKMLHFQANFKSITNDDGEEGVKIIGMASTNDQDRGDDIVDPHAFQESIVTTYKTNPIILFQHNSDRPIGKATSLEIKPKGLEIEAIIYDKEIGSLVKNGVLKTFSIGYLPKIVEYRDKNDEVIDQNDQAGRMRIWAEQGIKRIIKKLELLEVSIVSLPMNANALFSLSKSLETYFEEERKIFLESNNLSNNSTDMEKSKNLLEKKDDDQAVDPTPTEAKPEETTEPTPESAPAESAPETTEGAEKEGAESAPASESEVEEAESGEKPAESEGGETPAAETPQSEDAKPAEEGTPTTGEEQPASEETPEGEKSLKIDAKLFTKENFALALKDAKRLFDENQTLKARVKALEEELEKTPAKKALVFSHKLPSKTVSQVQKQEQKSEAKFAGFKDSLINAAN